jgi:ABC-type transporter Mla MlaB component
MMRDIMGNCNGNKLELVGALTIEHVNKAKTLLQEALLERDHLFIDVEKVTDVDLSGLQILCATHRTATKSGKTVVLDYKRSEALRLAVAQAGYGRHCVCSASDRKECYWTEESHG